MNTIAVVVPLLAFMGMLLVIWCWENRRLNVHISRLRNPQNPQEIHPALQAQLRKWVHRLTPERANRREQIEFHFQSLKKHLRTVYLTSVLDRDAGFIAIKWPPPGTHFIFEYRVRKSITKIEIEMMLLRIEFEVFDDALNPENH